MSNDRWMAPGAQVDGPREYRERKGGDRWLSGAESGGGAGGAGREDVKGLLAVVLSFLSVA